MEKKEYIGKLASFLVDNKKKMSANELAEHLNRNNFKTSYNTEYEGGRGIYTLIHATYDWFVEEKNDETAKAIADAFTKEDGSYAYDK